MMIIKGLIGGGEEAQKGVCEKFDLMTRLATIIDMYSMPEEGEGEMETMGTPMLVVRVAISLTWAIICGNKEVKKDMYHHERLVASLVAVIGKERGEWKVMKAGALGAIGNIAMGSNEVRKGLYDVEGLIALLVSVVGNEGEEWKVARENALSVIGNIALSSDEVRRRLYNYPDLIASLVAVIGA